MPVRCPWVVLSSSTPPRWDQERFDWQHVAASINEKIAILENKARGYQATLWGSVYSHMTDEQKGRDPTYQIAADCLDLVKYKLRSAKLVKKNYWADAEEPQFKRIRLE